MYCTLLCLAEQLQSKKEEKTATVAQGQQVADKAKEKGEFKQSCTVA